MKAATMRNKNQASHARFRRPVYGLLGVLGLFASASVYAVPPWMSAWVAALPAEAKPVWDACRTAGTLDQSGTLFLPGINCRMMSVDGYPRRYVVYVPNHPKLTLGYSVPLVVMYHGSSQSGEHFFKVSSWREEADQNGFIVAFPSGLTYELTTGQYETKWNSYGLLPDINPAWMPPGYPAAAPWPADDIKFTNQLLDDLIAQAPIDTRRLHASGFSNGGAMVSRLAIEVSDRLASVASVTNPYQTEYTPVARIPAFFALGTLDQNGIDGINATLLGGQLPITEIPLDPATLFSYVAMDQRRIAAANTFDLQPDLYMTTLDPTWTLMRWNTPQPGNTDKNMMWWEFMKGVEHEYPRGLLRRYPPNNPLAFDAPRIFYHFFEHHPK